MTEVKRSAVEQGASYRLFQLCQDEGGGHGKGRQEKIPSYGLRPHFRAFGFWMFNYLRQQIPTSLNAAHRYGGGLDTFVRLDPPTLTQH